VSLARNFVEAAGFGGAAVARAKRGARSQTQGQGPGTAVLLGQRRCRHAAQGHEEGSGVRGSWQHAEATSSD
jgi:hypothetical protein